MALLSRPVVSTKRLEGSLVAPRKAASVPNHLTAIKSFVPGSSTGVLQTSPTVLHFSGYRVGNVHKQTLRIINVSKDNQHMHIIPPSTAPFTINYTKKKSRLVPGLSLDITIEFRPTQWKYYYDCIRIHCKDDHNLLVPIHAYPVMSTAKFPSHVRFPATPVGRTRSKALSLECDVPIDFEFQLTPIQHHPAFFVTPMRGVVPANGRVDVMVTFAPIEFSTAIMKLKLELTQFNSIPLVCTFSGSSLPGLDIESVSSNMKSIPPAKLTKTIALPPLHKSRSQTDKGQLKKKTKTNSVKEGETKKKREVLNKTATSSGTVCKMNTPAAVNKLLTQRSSHKHVASGTQQEMGVSNRQTRESEFLKRVRQNAKEERANRLRWVTRLGASVPTPSHMEAMLRERQEATDLYCHKPVAGSELSHTHTQCLYRRTRRPANELPNVVPKFDHFSNNTWQKRHRARQAFIRAARRILIQVRVQNKLEKVRTLVSSMKNGTEDAKLYCPGEAAQASVSLPLPVNNVLPLSFPKFTAQENTISTNSPSFQVKPTEVRVQRQVPLMELKVPHQYQLLGYSATISPPLLGTYIPPGLPRPLRTGAEAELQSLGHVPGVNPAFLTPSSPPTLTPSHPHTTTTSTPPTSTTNTTQQPLTVQDIEADREGDRETSIRGTEEGEDTATRATILPPSNKHQVQSLDLFNPCPGVLHYVPPLPHSEVTVDHALLPLPLRPPSCAHTHPPLHPQDYIPGLMRWKPFPCLWLVANESVGRQRRGEGEQQTQSQPQPPPHQRLSDTFFSGLVSDRSVPSLLTGPQPDDTEEEQSCSELLPTPTLEMVRSQFHIPSPEPTMDHRKDKGKGKMEQPVSGTNGLGLRVQQRLESALALFNDSTDTTGKR